MNENYLPEQSDTASVDKEKQKFLNELKYTKEYLERKFGINNLSNIESERLKIIVKECLIEANETKEKINEKCNELEKNSSDVENKSIKKQIINLEHSQFIVRPESAVRWLFELYGINFNDIPYRYTVVNKTTNKKFEIFATSDNLNEQERKIEKMRNGNEISYHLDIDPKFIEYLQILRERSHLPAGL